jgi:endonuclease/exonuclease/phosphatase family metal-dependent hydrolase
MNYNKKYLKYKTKYKNIKELSGGLNHPIVGANSRASFDTKNQSTNFDTLLGPILSRNKEVDIKKPYMASEYGFPNMEKKNKFNKSGVYASLPLFDTGHAYTGEVIQANQNYCKDTKNIQSPFDYVVRFVSYNVHNFVKQCWTTETNSYPIGRDIAPHLDILQKLNADIVFIQEITPYTKQTGQANPSIESIDANFTYITKQFANIGLSQHFIADTHYSTNVDALDANKPYFMLCNAIISKHELTNKKTFELGNNRICMMAVFIKNTNLYVCFNVHIEFSEFILDSKRDCKYKETQIKKLAKLIYDESEILKTNTNYANYNIYYVLGGDFNNEFNNSLFNPIINVMGNPLEARMMDEDNPREIISGQNQHKLLDYFFAMGPEHTRQKTPIPEKQGFHNKHFSVVRNSSSDHYPIVFDMIPSTIKYR